MKDEQIISETRMHSSRMRTVRISSHLRGGDVSAQGGVCLPGGVFQGGCLPGGCLPRGVSAGGMSAQGCVSQNALGQTPPLWTE